MLRDSFLKFHTYLKEYGGDSTLTTSLIGRKMDGHDLKTKHGNIKLMKNSFEERIRM